MNDRIAQNFQKFRVLWMVWKRHGMIQKFLNRECTPVLDLPEQRFVSVGILGQSNKIRYFTVVFFLDDEYQVQAIEPTFRPQPRNKIKIIR
ncbi:MAG: hypothetical protein AB7O80_20700 [Acetobacteraceae bacterium]